MEYPNIANGDPVAHEVQVDLHMLHPIMLDGVSGPVIKTTFSRRENDVFTRKRPCETSV